MKLLGYFTACLLVGLAHTAPTSNSGESDKITITSDFFPDDFAIYTAEHEIVNIVVPLNALNFEDTDSSTEEDPKTVIFFVLADEEEGKRVDKGLFIRKDGVVTKLLDKGRDATAAVDGTKTAYFGAQDGIYTYNNEENKAEKYGTIEDSIIGIAKVNGSDVIYILTEDHVLYKVTEAGTNKEKVESVVNAQQIVLDHENNLFYATGDKKVYVLKADGVNQIEGLPQASSIKVIRPPFIMENGVPLVVDSKTFIALPNGTSEEGEFELEAYPTAYSMEATLIQYYGYNKKIYEYNILVLVLSGLVEDLKDFLSDKSESISEIASKSRSDFLTK